MTTKDLFNCAITPIIFAIESTNDKRDLDEYNNHFDSVILDIECSEAVYSQDMDEKSPDFPNQR